MPTNQRLTQEPVELLHAGTEDQRLTALPVEVLHGGSEAQRLTQLSVEVLTAETTVAVLRVTQTGARAVQQRGHQAVTQTSAAVAQQAGRVRVTQIGLYIIYREGEAPPEPPPEEVCVIELPSAACWGGPAPTAQAIAETPVTPSGDAVTETPTVPTGQAVTETPTVTDGETWTPTHSPDVFRVGVKESDNT